MVITHRHLAYVLIITVWLVAANLGAAGRFTLDRLAIGLAGTAWLLWQAHRD